MVSTGVDGLLVACMALEVLLADTKVQVGRRHNGYHRRSLLLVGSALQPPHPMQRRGSRRSPQSRAGGAAADALCSSNLEHPGGAWASKATAGARRGRTGGVASQAARGKADLVVGIVEARGEARREDQRVEHNEDTRAAA